MKYSHLSGALFTQVWDRWPSHDSSSPPSPTLAGSALLPLASLAEMAQPGGPTIRTLFLPVKIPDSPTASPADDERLDDEDQGPQQQTLPQLEVQLQYEAAFYPGSIVSPSDGVGQYNTSHPSVSHLIGVSESGILATLSVDIIQACGLQVGGAVPMAWVRMLTIMQV